MFFGFEIQEEFSILNVGRIPKSTWFTHKIDMMHLGRGEGIMELSLLNPIMGSFVQEDLDFSNRLIWIPNLLRKEYLLPWLPARRVILMAEILWKRKILYASWCYICKGSSEDVNHLHVRCPIASSLWWEFLTWFGIFG